MDFDRETLAHTGIAGSNTGAPKRAQCRVTSGAETGTVIALGARPVTIGADGACDLVLSDSHASRKHAELQLTQGGVRVRDLGSTNGTFYQGSRVTEVVVPVGATVKVGETVLELAESTGPRVPPSERERFGALVGDSPLMREIFAILELASPTEATVLIEGESGTGKELVARAIHDHSERAQRPFVVVDCSAIQESLIDSHFFGHRKGAFTGAVSDRRGAFVAATGGTVFLDEMGELPLPQQAKLLRALEDQTIQPVGSDERVKIDTRVVGATHRDLRAMVEAGSFRFDLFHRLAVVHIRIPPLRDRPEDLRALVASFYDGRGFEPGAIEGDNLDAMKRYAWPGNVRELRNALERAWVLTPESARQFAQLELWLGPGTDRAPAGEIDTTLDFKEAKERVVSEFERRYLAAVWRKYEFNITHAAEHAGINRRHFRELLQKHGISKPTGD